ncbi:hypothetical protein [Antarctobacter heliothermus]|nr:hypothetical protein [Antarctobacter heliothermus]
MIFAQGRTGSTLLTSTLNMHPDIRCDDEILIVPRVFPLKFVERAARVSPTSAYGFHVKITQLHAWQRLHDVAGFLAHMERRGWTIIYLWRDNALRHVVSNIFAETAGTYHMDGGEKTRPEKITLPLPRLERELKLRLKLREAERAALHGRAFHEIQYERDLQHPERQIETFATLQTVIGVPQANITPRLKKMVAAPLADLIENFAEVTSWIAGKPEYQRYLDG